MEHEWLHAVVAFYNPRLGWPTPDVHGACEHGYSPGPCPSGMTNEAYFADLMQGKVPEAGTLKGIQPDEWTLQGTPANPLIHLPPLSIAVGRDGKFAVRFPADLGGPIQLAIARPSGQVAREASVTTPGSEFEVPGKGRWEVCLNFAGSERYYKQSSCSLWSLTKAESCDLRPRRGRQRLPLHITHRGRRYRVVAAGVPAACDATLIVRHGKRKRRIRGRRYGGSTVFHLTARGPGPWSVVLRVNEGGGGLVTSRRYKLHPAP